MFGIYLHRASGDRISTKFDQILSLIGRLRDDAQQGREVTLHAISTLNAELHAIDTVTGKLESFLKTLGGETK